MNNESIQEFLRAVKAAKDHAKTVGLKKGHGGIGETKCPNCEGTIKYSVASVNGHMWGSCSTEGCAKWME
jgi:hypothetical protein